MSVKRKVWDEETEQVLFHKLHGVTVEDNEDGTYLVRFTAQEPGDYIVEVSFLGTFGGAAGKVRGTPVQVINCR